MNRTMTRTLVFQLAVLLIAGCSVDTGEPVGSASRTVGKTIPLKQRAERPVAPIVDIDEIDRDASSETGNVLKTSVVDPEVSTEHAPDVFDDADHARLGREAWTRGEIERAASELRLAIDRGQADAYDIYLLGLSLWKSGELEAAEQLLTEASWKMQSFVRAPVNLARVRLERGDSAGARAALDEALSIDPEFGPAYNVLGRVLLSVGDADAAAAAFQRAAELSPDDPWPLNNLGYMLLIEQRGEEAVAPLEQAVARNEQLAVAWHNLALAREQAGDLVSAVMAAQRAAELSDQIASYAATEERIAALVPPELLTSPESAPEAALAVRERGETDADIAMADPPASDTDAIVPAETP
ncbi:MAG: tetratricopeptide repeat protein [Acidobacteriota bacterium]|nr:MAG: tetratricopeptide repeat protein [Acidobacteriota bacterium]